ncbi:MAG: class I SAM-dependent methyltransferase, partial [Cyanobacteria bacterium J149]
SSQYDKLHLQDEEHDVALKKAWSMLTKNFNIESVLDVGCGTGRGLIWLSTKKPSLNLMGVEPSEGMLNIARQNIPQANLLLATGEQLPFPDNSVDFVMATGIMHHVDFPQKVIKEMFRVSSKAVLISDHNNFAFRGFKARQLRLWLWASGLLNIVTFIKQGFKKQGYSEEDGWWYPYSLLNDFALISSLSSESYIIPTRRCLDKQGNFLLSQSHLAILAIKTPLSLF